MTAPAVEVEDLVITYGDKTAVDGLSLAVDQGDGGEIYVARFLPRAKVTGFSEQSFGSGDDPITWGVTFTGEEDSDLGYSERWIFAGPGWNALLTDMGFGA